MLPVGKRSQELVADILPVTKVGDAVIRAKTGLDGQRARLARLAGRLGRDSGGDVTVFAMNMDCKTPAQIDARMRRYAAMPHRHRRVVTS